MRCQGSLTTETMTPNQTHTKRLVLSSLDGPSDQHPTPNGDHLTSTTISTTPPFMQEVNGHHASTMAAATPSTQFLQEQVSRPTITVSQGHQPDLRQTSPMAESPPSHHTPIHHHVSPSTHPTPQNESAAAGAERLVVAPKADPQQPTSQLGEVSSAAVAPSPHQTIQATHRARTQTHMMTMMGSGNHAADERKGQITLMSSWLVTPLYYTWMRKDWWVDICKPPYTGLLHQILYNKCVDRFSRNAYVTHVIIHNVVNDTMGQKDIDKIVDILQKSFDKLKCHTNVLRNSVCWSRTIQLWFE